MRSILNPQETPLSEPHHLIGATAGATGGYEIAHERRVVVERFHPSFPEMAQTSIAHVVAIENRNVAGSLDAMRVDDDAFHRLGCTENASRFHHGARPHPSSISGALRAPA